MQKVIKHAGRVQSIDCMGKPGLTMVSDVRRQIQVEINLCTYCGIVWAQEMMATLSWEQTRPFSGLLIGYMTLIILMIILFAILILRLRAIGVVPLGAAPQGDHPRR